MKVGNDWQDTDDGYQSILPVMGPECTPLKREVSEYINQPTPDSKPHKLEPPFELTRVTNSVIID